MIPRMDVYVLHFNVSTKHGKKSYDDFKRNMLKMTDTDKNYCDFHETDHLGYKEVTFRQFSNRRNELIKMFEMARINKLITDFQVYGN